MSYDVATRTYYGYSGKVVTTDSDIANVAPFEDERRREFALAEKPSNPKDLIGSTKLPLGIVPGSTKALLSIGHIEGHLKYGLVNWREAGVKFMVYIDAAYRHLDKLIEGQWEDPVTTVPHLANALACLSIITDAAYAGKLIDNRPTPLGGKFDPLPQPMGLADLIDNMSEKVQHLQKLFGDKKPTDYFITGPKPRE